MITLDRCKEMLNNGMRKYDSQEIKQIRDYLYFIGQIDLENNPLNIN